MLFNFSFTQKKQKRTKWNCPIDLCFFYLFLLTFSLEIRKVVWFLPIKNTFNEYNGTYIYLSDLFLFFTILPWIVLILNNEKSYLSIKASSFFTYWKKRNNALNLNIFFIPLVLFFWSLFSAFWSENKIISLYRSGKFFELYLLFLYVTLRFFPYCWMSIKKKSILTNKQEFPINLNEHKNQLVSRETSLENFEQEKLIISKIHLFFRAILFGLLFIGLFDHYLWDIWQGQILFWMTMGVLFGNFLYAKNKNANGSYLKIPTKDSNNQLLNSNRITKYNTIPFFAFINLFIFMGTSQAIIGIIQFFRQSSLGLFWLKESLISEKIAGVAKIIVNQHPLIRAYGLFPHPNIFAGFLFFLIMLTILYRNLFHVKQRKTSFFIYIILVIEIFALILSFSKSAILALLLAILYVNVSRETLSAKYKSVIMAKIKPFKLTLLLITLLGTAFFILHFLKVDFYTLFIKSLNERYLYFFISKQTILNSPLIGIGEGQFITNATKTFPNLETWQYQPVHNIFLLIWSEWGIIGLVLFILFLWKLFHIEPMNKIKNSKNIK